MSLPMPSKQRDTLCNAAKLSAAREAHWRPGLGEASHSEVFASGWDGSGAGVALALAVDELRHADRSELVESEDCRSILWVQDRKAVRLNGRPYRPGLPPELRHRLIHVAVDKAEDALFALEEGLRCRDLACVIGEIAGNPRALDFTASRRLTLAVEKHGVPLWLVRLDADHDLSSARMRWQVACAPSPQPEWNGRAPGMPSWQAELFRARSHAPGQWILHDDERHLVATRTTTPHPVGMVFAAGDGSLAAR